MSNSKNKQPTQFDYLVRHQFASLKLLIQMYPEKAREFLREKDKENLVKELKINAAARNEMANVLGLK